MDKLEILAKELGCNVADIDIVDEEVFRVGDKKYMFLDEWQAEDKSDEAADQLLNDALRQIPEDLRDYFRTEDFYDDNCSLLNAGDYKEIIEDGYYYFLFEL